MMGVSIFIILLGGVGALVLLAAVIGLTIWQVRLSKSERAWPGLVIPLLQAGFAAFMVLGYYAVMRVMGVATSGVAQAVVAVAAWIPAIVSVVIYVICRMKRGGN